MSNDYDIINARVVVNNLRRAGVEGKISFVKITKRHVDMTVVGLKFSLMFETISRVKVWVGEQRVSTTIGEAHNVILVALAGARQLAAMVLEDKSAGTYMCEFESGVVERYRCAFCGEYHKDYIKKGFHAEDDRPHSDDCPIARATVIKEALRGRV
jgi:hypothetical protein